MRDRERQPGFREGMPPWAWVVLVATRLAALLPFALLVAGLWWWSHGGAERAPKLAKQAARHVRAAADSLFGR